MKKKLLILMMVLATAITTLLMLPSKSASAYEIRDNYYEWEVLVEGPDIVISVEGEFENGSGTYKISASYEFVGVYLYMNDFLVDITIPECQIGPSKKIYYHNTDFIYSGYRGYVPADKNNYEIQSCMFDFSIVASDGYITLAFSDDYEYFAPFDYCDFYDTVDLTYEGNFELYSEFEFGADGEWADIGDQIIGVEEITVPNEALSGVEKSSCFEYKLNSENAIEFDFLELETSGYVDNEYLTEYSLDIFIRNDADFEYNSINLTMMINGKNYEFIIQNLEIYELYEEFTSDDLDYISGLSFVLYVYEDTANLTLAFDSDEFLVELDLDEYIADKYQILEFDFGGKNIYLNDNIEVYNLNKLDSGYARECITMVEEDFGSLTTSGEHDEEYIERVNNVMNSFTTKEDLRNKLDFVCNSSLSDVLFYQGYDAGYNAGTSADVKDAIDKFITDNNYHTNDEYLEYGRDQYLDGFNDGSNGGDNIFDDLEDPVEEDDSSFFEELFTKDNLIYLICLVALCSFIASLFRRR